MALSRITRRISSSEKRGASILQRGVDSGEFRADLEITSVADLICPLQADYSSRAYRRDPRFPANPERIDAAVRVIHQAVRES